MKVLVLPKINEQNKQKLLTHFPEIQFIFETQDTVTQEIIDSADIIVGNPRTKIVLYNENLKALFLNSAGSDAYVKEGVLHPHTRLANASGSYGVAIAEHMIGMILSMNKNFRTFYKNMENHLWQNAKGGKEIYGSTVLIVGLGDLGYEIAKRLKAFNSHIIGVKRRLCDLPEYVDELYTTDQLDSLLPRADYVILCLPQSKETYHLFNKERLMLMKESAIIANIGRGSAIDTNDLINVLKQGHLYGALLDVVEEEPLSPSSPLWDIDNVFITPHASGGFKWYSVQNYYFDLVIRNLHHLLNNEELENEVDFTTGYRRHVFYKK